MTTWSADTVCAVCGESKCDCSADLRRVEWSLRNDMGAQIGIVQYFAGSERWYGNSVHGRTGPVDDVEVCKAKVERMIETGRATHER